MYTEFSWLYSYLLHRKKVKQESNMYIHTYLQSHLLDKTQKRGDNSQLVAVNSNNRKSQSSSVVSSNYVLLSIRFVY